MVPQKQFVISYGRREIVDGGRWIFYCSLRKRLIKYTKCHISNHRPNRAYFRCRIVLQNRYLISGWIFGDETFLHPLCWVSIAGDSLFNERPSSTIATTCTRTTSISSRCRQQNFHFQIISCWQDNWDVIEV
jgi:hypothetical protein